MAINCGIPKSSVSTCYAKQSKENMAPKAVHMLAQSYILTHNVVLFSFFIIMNSLLWIIQNMYPH